MGFLPTFSYWCCLISGNILGDPREVFGDGGVSRVVLAIFDHETGNPVHSPRAIAVSAHQWTTRITSASVGVCDFSMPHTHHLRIVLAALHRHYRHTRLHQEVGGSPGMSGRAPPCNITALCSDWNWRG